MAVVTPPEVRGEGFVRPVNGGEDRKEMGVLGGGNGRYIKDYPLCV